MKLLTPSERLRVLTGTQLLRRRPDWQAGFWAGLLSGALMAVCVLAADFGLGLGVWRPIRLAASIILGGGVMATPGTPDLAILIVALAVHFGLSGFYALVVADATVFVRRRAAVLMGAAMGAALCALNLYVFTAVFPWFSLSRGVGAFFAHVGFGACTAWLYKRMESPIVRKLGPRGPALRASPRAP